jgi:AhpC/TSA family/Disulphide bond corrector protein DsbC
VELQGRLEDIRRSGFGLAAISYDPMRVTADFSQRRGITFPLLTDAGSAVITRYGILNTTVPPTNQQVYGVPFPGTFVVDRNGIVTSRVFETAYQERDTMSSLIVRLGGRVDAPAMKIGAPHLDLTTFSTDQTVAPGTHFSLVIDAVPGKRVHVYAPGASGYKPITLTIQPQAGLLVRDIRLPKAENYFFKPLKEHVDVYQKPFRLQQDLTIDPSPQSEAALRGTPTMTIRATLEYQACDDKVCFLPQRTPLEWTVNVRTLDRERPE